MSCFKSNITVNVCYATVLLNVSIYLVFVGNGWLSLVPSCLPHLRQLDLYRSYNMCYKSVQELENALPELNIMEAE